MVRKFVMLSGIICLLFTANSSFSAPNLINYQGTLTDGVGQPVDGTVSIVFSLYDSGAGGVPLWQETQNVTVNQGVFNVRLGVFSPINLSFDQPYFLGIKAGADPEMSPLQPLTNAPYSFRANIADDVKDQSITAAKLGEVCADGEFLRFDAKDNRWICSPSAGTFAPQPPPVAFITIEPWKPDFGSDPFLDPFLRQDILVYKMDWNIQMKPPPGAQIIMSPVRVVCDPKTWSTRFTQAIITGQRLDAIHFFRPDTNGNYGEFLTLVDVYVGSQRLVAPLRQGEQSLMEYLLIPQEIKTVSGPDNVAYNLMTQVATGDCAVPLNPHFLADRGLPYNPKLFTGAYTVNDHSFFIDQTLSLVQGQYIQQRLMVGVFFVSMPESPDFPCFFSKTVRFTEFNPVTLHTLAPQSVVPGQTLEETVIEFERAIITRLDFFTNDHGEYKQSMSFDHRGFNMSYYPYDPKTGETGAPTEMQWTDPGTN